MKSVKELREDRAQLVAKAEAYTQLAKAENRELSADEQSDFNAIINKSLPELDAKIESGEKLESYMAKLAAERAPATNPHRPQVNVIDPLNRQRHGKLHGYENREEAFRAGCWFAATFFNHAGAIEHCKTLGIQNAMATSSNATGGFLVPEEMERAIIRLVETYGVFRQNARVVPMMSDTLHIPRRTAGVTSYYVGEVPSSITESSPTVGQAQLVAKVLAVRTLVSRDLLEDAIIAIVDWVTNEIALSFAQAEDNAGFLGDGTSTYGGIMGLETVLGLSAHSASKFTAATGETSFGALTTASLVKMIGTLPRYALNGAKWYISQAGYWNSMARLQMAGGGNNVADLGGGPVLQFAGYPVVISQVMNSTVSAQASTDGLAYFGNLAMAASFGNRRGIETQVLNELYAATRQVGLISTQRFDINVHERGDTSTAGPIVMLSTPAS